MNKKTIDKKLDEQFGEQVDKNTMWHFNRAGINGVKQFIHEQIEKVIDELVGEKFMVDKKWGEQYKELAEQEELGYNTKRQEIIKKAQEMGYYEK